MKNRTILLLAVLVMAGAVGAFAIYDKGEGGGKSVTATHVRVSGFTVNDLSIYNDGPSNVYVAVNCTTGELAGKITAGTAILLVPGLIQPFNCYGNSHIDSYTYVAETAGGTATIYVGGF